MASSSASWPVARDRVKDRRGVLGRLLLPDEVPGTGETHLEPADFSFTGHWDLLPSSGWLTIGSTTAPNGDFAFLWRLGYRVRLVRSIGGLAEIQRLLAGRAGAKKSMRSWLTRSCSSWWTQCEASGRRSTWSRLGTSSCSGSASSGPR